MSLQSASAPNKALFISQEFLKSYAPMSGNVDIALVFPHVEAYQSLYIQDVLGTSLYIDLQNKVVANTLSNIEIQLLDLCRQAIAWGALAKALPWINIQVRNKGLEKQTSDNASNADLADLKYLRNEANNTANFYIERIKRFLCDNSQSFPEFLEGNEDVIPSNSSSYHSGLYLGPANGSCDAKTVLKKYFL